VNEWNVGELNKTDAGSVRRDVDAEHKLGKKLHLVEKIVSI